MEQLSPEIQSHVERAMRLLQAARDLLQRGQVKEAAANAAQSVFHSAAALLQDEEINLGRHQDVIALLQAKFVEKRRLTKEQGAEIAWLIGLGDATGSGESLPVASGEAARAVEIAGSFLAAAKVILEA